MTQTIPAPPGFSSKTLIVEGQYFKNKKQDRKLLSHKTTKSSSFDYFNEFIINF